MGTVLRPAEVARELRISRVTVYELIRRGELPATRVGHQFRIEASALATYRAEHHEGGRPAQSTRQGTLVIRAEDHLVTLSVPDDLESLPAVELAAAFSRRAGVQRTRYRGVPAPGPPDGAWVPASEPRPGADATAESRARSGPPVGRRGARSR